MSAIWTAISAYGETQSLLPNWSDQSHILVSFLVFAGFVSWIIYDKQKKINEFEGSYEYALSFDGLGMVFVGGMLEIKLNFTNTLGKPIEYSVENIHLEIGGNSLTDFRYKSRGQVIPREKSAAFGFPAIKTPSSIPCKGSLGYELVYGRPGKPMFRQIREMDITLRIVGLNKNLVWEFTRQEDHSIKK